MNSKTPLYRLPLPSTDFDGDATFCDSILSFRYLRGGVLYRSGIRFDKISATRTRAERCCKAWHVEGVYDTLVEVEGSTWLEEIQADTQEMWRDQWKMHHYMICLDSAGCFEVAAASWDVLPEEPGS